MTGGRGEGPSDRSAVHPSLVPPGRDRPAGPADLAEQLGWRRLLAAARRRLERTGGRLDTTVTLSTPTDDERLFIIGITGTTVPPPRPDSASDSPTSISTYAPHTESA